MICSEQRGKFWCGFHHSEESNHISRWTVRATVLGDCWRGVPKEYFFEFFFNLEELSIWRWFMSLSQNRQICDHGSIASCPVVLMQWDHTERKASVSGSLPLSPYKFYGKARQVTAGDWLGENWLFVWFLVLHIVGLIVRHQMSGVQSVCNL